MERDSIKRLIYRLNYRGFKEMDRLMQSIASHFLSPLLDKSPLLESDISLIKTIEKLEVMDDYDIYNEVTSGRMFASYEGFEQISAYIKQIV